MKSNQYLFLSKISCGFPSPADDHYEEKLDLNDLLIKHPAATFFVRASGNSMQNAGIYDGDILVVDRSLAPQHNKIIVAVINNELTVKRIKKSGKKIFLLAENPKYPPLELKLENQVHFWGVVIYAIHKL